ncbi:MAG: putative protein kinase domain protein [Streblomastix strix]|uniref:non-specific serine/threonine protein kinase n=1 Tax=Streblomastix strix TaxID=222440 RepID=A0A5J4W0G0_9EUKA|nr:MAG: putative protein kinase domain protein [Streblomastix strix]
MSNDQYQRMPDQQPTGPDGQGNNPGQIPAPATYPQGQGQPAQPYTALYPAGNQQIYAQIPIMQYSPQQGVPAWGNGLLETSTAYLLSMLCLVGVHGMHRIYLGNPVIGVICCLTGGVCCIGTCVDYCLIPSIVEERNQEIRKVARAQFEQMQRGNTTTMIPVQPIYSYQAPVNVTIVLIWEAVNNTIRFDNKNLIVKMADKALLDEYKSRSNSPSAPMLTLADFANLKLLSEGGYGKAYIATFKRTGQEVVLKQMKFHNEAEEQMVNQEIEIHKNVQFRFIAKFIAQFRQGDYEQYIVLEYCRGGDLHDYIVSLYNKRKTADENFVWDVIAQLVMSVGFLHSQRVVHRDMKPSNVFLTQDLEVRLGDFGIAKVLDAGLSFAKSMKGTVRYIPPELLQEEKFHKSGDIWGIGVTIYELLAQRSPFEAPAPIPPQKYSDRLRNLVSAMLEKDRLKRIPLNLLVKITEINQRIKAYAKEMIGTSQGNVHVYLQHLIDDIDPIPPKVPKISEINSDGSYTRTKQIPVVNAPFGSVHFDIRDEQIATQRIGENPQSLARLIQLSDMKRNTVSISPELQAGIGVVQIAICFGDAKGENRAYRWIGVVFSGYTIPYSYYPGQSASSAGYCGSDGSIVHIKDRMSDKYIDGNSPYENGEIVIVEVNMHSEREQRTLHFFAKDIWQPISFVGLPDRIKFCVQRYFSMTTATVISMKQLPSSTAVSDVPNARVIPW